MSYIPSINATIAGNTSGTLGLVSSGTLTLAGGNNITLSQAGNAVTISGANASQSNQTLGMYAQGNTTGLSSTSTMNATSMNFSGAGALSLGYSASSLQISAPATSSLVGTGLINIVTNGSTISIGVQASSTPQVRFEWPQNQFQSIGQTGQGSLSLQEIYVPFNLTANNALIAGSLSAATSNGATTASVNNSLYMGIYTLNGSTLSLASSGSQLNNFAWSQAASTTANTSVNSMRYMYVNMNVSMTPGRYWVGALISQATTYTSMGFSVYGGTGITNGASNVMYAAVGDNTTNAKAPFQFQGIYTAATNAMPTSIPSAAINFTSASNPQRANYHLNLYNGGLY